MESIASTFSADHRRCDELFIAVEQAVSKGEWERAADAVGSFVDGMLRHFEMEEEALFPALLAASPGGQGPVQVMHMEHQQMRGLFTRLREAVQQQDARGCLDATETLLMLMQQHNMKEENILYPMADRDLGAEGRTLAQRMAQP